MGFAGAVDIIQAAVRQVMYVEAKVPTASELGKDRQMPGPSATSLVYLDGFHFKRIRREALQEYGRKGSKAREQVELACARLNLPLNALKRVVGAFRSQLLGGEFDDELGRLGLGPTKVGKIWQQSLGFSFCPHLVPEHGSTLGRGSHIRHQFPTPASVHAGISI